MLLFPHFSVELSIWVDLATETKNATLARQGK